MCCISISYTLVIEHFLLIKWNNKMSTNQQKRKITFEDIKSDILLALQDKAKALGEPVNLVEGFISGPFSSELSNSTVLGGATIPMVMLVGKESGRIYFFALKALINIEI